MYLKDEEIIEIIVDYVNDDTRAFISGCVCAMANGLAKTVPQESKIATVLLDFDTSIPTAIMWCPPS